MHLQKVQYGKREHIQTDPNECQKYEGKKVPGTGMDHSGARVLRWSRVLNCCVWNKLFQEGDTSRR